MEPAARLALSPRPTRPSGIWYRRTPLGVAWKMVAPLTSEERDYWPYMEIGKRAMMTAMNFGTWVSNETDQSINPQETGPMSQPNRGRYLKAPMALSPNLVTLSVDG